MYHTNQKVDQNSAISLEGGDDIEKIEIRLLIKAGIRRMTVTMKMFSKMMLGIKML